MGCRNSFLHVFLFLLHAIISCSADDKQIPGILYNLSPFMIVFKNGAFIRLRGNDFKPPGHDLLARVRSKDIDISVSYNISARLFLPDDAPKLGRKLPLLVYYHGGAFCTESPFSPNYHDYANTIASKAQVVVVSVNYRLAPDNPLPTGYEDSWRALKWVFSHYRGKGPERWLQENVDFNRVYLGGDSSGGNIAHNVAVRAGIDKTYPVEITGMFLNCPHFWGAKRIGKESVDPEGIKKMEKIWKVVSPKSTGLDDPTLNPAKNPNISRIGVKEVLVHVAGEDLMRDRGIYYAETLRKSKWQGKVNIKEAKGMNHVFDILFPNLPESEKMMEDIVSFLSGHLKL